MKKCAMCKVEKDECEFHKNNRKKDGLATYCKECVSKRNKTTKVRNSPSQRKAWADGQMAKLRLNDNEY